MSRSGNEVARYYDSNTQRFLALGGGARSHAIHRPLWGPGVSDTHAAANYVNVLIGDAIEALQVGSDFRLLDFGCGVGGSMFALARRFPDSTLDGVTISKRQYDLAYRIVQQLGHESNCRFHCGDFESIDLGIQADIVIAIESIVHAESLPAFVENVAKHLKPKGTLIVVDDFIAAAETPVESERKVLADFRSGWRLSSLTTVPAFVSGARTAGFELDESRDLSPMIRLTRPRDRVIAAISPVLRHFTNVPMFANLVGGAALTRGTRAGLLGYRLLRLSRPLRL